MTTRVTVVLIRWNTKAALCLCPKYDKTRCNRSCLYDTTQHHTKCSRHVPCVLEVTAACVCLCPEYDTTLCHRGSRRRLSVCQPYDTTTQLTEGSCHISSVSIKTTLQLSRWQQRRSAMRENESSSCRVILVTMQCRVIVLLYQKLITSITLRNLQIVYFVGMSHQAAALVPSRM